MNEYLSFYFVAVMHLYGGEQTLLVVSLRRRFDYARKCRDDSFI